MFVGAINATIRKFLGNRAHVFNDRVLVVGCSGNFTSESVISAYSTPQAIHSNDVSFYSCLAGRWLTGQMLDFEIAAEDYNWLKVYLKDGDRTMAAIMVLLDMLEFEKRHNDHTRRMWAIYKNSFPDLVEKTLDKLEAARGTLKVNSFFAGDVLDHFERFGDDKQAIFCCYAPTYAGGYERLYKKLDEIVSWDAPKYRMLDDEARDRLLDWMTARSFLWYDDRLIEGMTPILEQRSGRRKTVYLYSNVVAEPAYFDDRKIQDLPKILLAGSDFEIRASSQIDLMRIKTTELGRFKDAFLGKNIVFGQGMWAFAVMIDGRCAGFLEFQNGRYDRSYAYMMADFAVPGTRYKRLSKLIVMLARAGETRRLLERTRQIRTHAFSTTAFTDKPVSMKYRGVMDLVKRGESEAGEKFLQYEAQFNDLSWKETLDEWLTKHGSKT